MLGLKIKFWGGDKMQPVQGGFLVKDESGNWTTQRQRPQEAINRDNTTGKVARMSREELNRDLNSATAWKPGDRK